MTYTQGSWYFLIPILILCSVSAPAAGRGPVQEDLSFWLDFGGRQDSLDWSIGFENSSPDILSELVWNKLQIAQIGVGFQIVLKDALFVEANGGFGSIYKGQLEDSDYALDDRGALWSKSENSSDEGGVGDLSLVLGYQWYPGQRSPGAFRVIPLLGGNFHYIDIGIDDGNQVYSDQINADLLNAGITVQPVGRFPGLDSSYKAAYWGASLGVDVRAGRQLSGWLRGLYHAGWYYGEGDWNLRSQFAHPRSYSHEAVLEGFSVEIGLRYQGDDGWFGAVALKDRQLDSESGDHVTYFQDGSQSVIQFNGAQWQSRSMALQFGRDF